MQRLYRRTDVRLSPAPTVTDSVAAAAITCSTPAAATALHRSLDAVIDSGAKRLQTRLEDRLECGVDAKDPKALLRGYARERCALAVATRVYKGGAALRDGVVEKGGRGLVNAVCQKAGQSVAFVVAAPVHLLGARDTHLPHTLGQGTAKLLAYPCHAGLEVVAVVLSVAAGGGGAIGLVVGFVVGAAASGVVLAITPTEACRAWLQLHGLKVSAERTWHSTWNKLVDIYDGPEQAHASDGKAGRAGATVADGEFWQQGWRQILTQLKPAAHPEVAPQQFEQIAATQRHYFDRLAHVFSQAPSALQPPPAQHAQQAPHTLGPQLHAYVTEANAALPKLFHRLVGLRRHDAQGVVDAHLDATLALQKAQRGHGIAALMQGLN